MTDQDPPRPTLADVFAGRVAPADVPRDPASGHAWVDAGPLASCDACARCGVCRRADGRNKPCPGVAPRVATRT